MTDKSTESGLIVDVDPSEDFVAANYEGFIDAVEDGRIFGWALDTEDPDRKLGIDIFHGTERIGQVTADRYREDLVQYGDGSGKHAFVFTLPKEFWTEDAASFYACYEDSNVPLLRGQRCSRLRPLKQLPVTQEEAGDTGETPDIAALLGRIEACEQAVVTLLRLVHPGSEMEKTKALKVGEVQSSLEGLRGELASLESFVVRNDERLKKAETTLRRIDDPEELRWFERTHALGGIASVAILGLFVALYFIYGGN